MKLANKAPEMCGRQVFLDPRQGLRNRRSFSNVMGFSCPLRLPWEGDGDTTLPANTYDEWLCAECMARYDTLYGRTGWTLTLSDTIVALESHQGVVVATTLRHVYIIKEGCIAATQPADTLVALSDNRLLLASSRGFTLVSEPQAMEGGKEEEAEKDAMNETNKGKETKKAGGVTTIFIPWNNDAALAFEHLESIALLEDEGQCYVAMQSTTQTRVCRMMIDENNEATLQHQSDLDRVHLLRAVGGFWMGVRDQQLVWYQCDSTDDTPTGYYTLAEAGRVLDWQILSTKMADRSAVAVVQKTGPSTLATKILQLETVSDNLIHPHVLYNMQVEIPAARDATLAVPTAPWAFRLQVAHGRSSYQYQDWFVNQEQADAVASLQWLVARGDLEAAEEALVGSVLPEEACFHPSQIALAQLTRLLKRKDCDDFEDCWRRLAGGAVTTGGLDYLLQARDVVVEHASSLAVLEDALRQLSNVLDRVVSGLPAEQVTVVEAKRRSVGLRLEALRFVREHNCDVESKELKSPATLFRVLVSTRQFDLASDLYRAAHVSTEVVVTSTVQLDATVDPSDYMDFLSIIVLPHMAVNHELMPKLQAWGCRIADALDADNRLDQAIRLLEVR